MARKRMFDMEIVDTDLFLDMPQSSQNLYFHLGMRADDDGFVSNPKKIIKIIGANDDDLKLLFLKKFVIPFESGVCVITHWKLNNYLRKDRYIETIYKEEKKQLVEDENGVYSLGIPKCNQMLTNGIHSIEENSIEKKSIEEKRIDIIDDNERYVNESLQSNTNVTQCNTNINQKHQDIINIYNTYCGKLPKIQKLTDKRKTAVNKLLKEFTIEQFEEICINANESDFLTGKNDRGWKADFDFIIRPDKAIKILEGQYNNKRIDKMDGFTHLWKEAQKKDEQDRNSTNNNTFSW